MKSSRFILLGLAVFALTAALVIRTSEFRMAQAMSDVMNSSVTSARHQTDKPVVLELFTSEGCSSCPPADALLTSLTRTQPVSGVHVIPLAEHVDYWNNLGWNDRFSSRDYSARQSDYSRQFRLDSVYTPQLVVDGHAQFVGSDRDAALQAIADAAARPKADVTIASHANGDALSVTATVQNLPHGVRSADVMLAVTESGLSTHVEDGENSGRTLSHNGVVRTLESIGSVTAGSVFDQTATVNLKPGWKRDELQVVVFVQDQETHRIVGADEIGL